jgi:hypothetical protein
VTGPLEARLQALAPLAVRALQDIARTGAPRDQARARRALRAYGLDQDRVQQSPEAARAGEAPQGRMCGPGDA